MICRRSFVWSLRLQAHQVKDVVLVCLQPGAVAAAEPAVYHEVRATRRVKHGSAQTAIPIRNNTNYRVHVYIKYMYVMQKT